MPVETFKITEFVAHIINRMWLIIIPFTIWYLFKDWIKTLIYYVKLRWSNEPYSVRDGEVFVDGHWWIIKKTSFSNIILERKDENNESGRNGSWKIERRITVLKFWNGDITFKRRFYK